MAYLRTFKVRSPRGQLYEYLQLVESYRENGRNRQRILVNLGRKDDLGPHLDALNRALAHGGPHGAGHDTKALEASCWGPILALRTLWRDLSLEEVFDQADLEDPRKSAALADRSFVLVASRLIPSTGKNALVRLLENNYVCDRKGRRWLDSWNDPFPHGYPGGRRREAWARTQDQILSLKPRIEDCFYRYLRRYLSARPDMVLYEMDLGQASAEGQAPVRVVFVKGWPLTVYGPGAGELSAVLTRLRREFEIGRLVLIQGRRTVIGLEGELREEPAENRTALEYLERATDEWIDCSGGLRVQEVPSDESGLRAFVVESEDRKIREQAERESAIKRSRRKLEDLRKRIAAGRIKVPAKITEAAARILDQNHSARYFDWEYTRGRDFRYFEDSVAVAREKACEGRHVVLTRDPDLGPEQVARHHRDLDESDRALGELREMIGQERIGSEAQPRAEALVLVAVLARFVQRVLEQKLRQRGVEIPASLALEALRTICIVDFNLGDGRTQRTISSGSARCVPILQALGITDLNPPSP